MRDLCCSTRTQAFICGVALGLIAHSEASAVELRFDGVLRHRFEQLDNFALDDEGLLHEQTSRGLLRLHASTELKFSRSFFIRSTLQFFDGQVLGKQSAVDPGPHGDGWRHSPFLDQVFLREAVVQVPIGLGVATAGRIPIHWGMGLVVNNGVTRADPFNDPDRGDIVNGAWLDVKPLLPLSRSRAAQAIRLSGGAGILERDELTNRRDGDLGTWAAGALRWHEPALTVGAYGSYRNIRRYDADRVMHYLVDVAWRWRALADEVLSVTWSGEVAYVGGELRHTDDDGRGARIEAMQLGGATRLDIADHEHGLGYILEAGYASGDSDPNDALDQRFLMDPARGIGAILFEEVLARSSAQTYVRWLGGQEEGSRERPDLYPSNGAVHGAVYIAPRIILELCDGCIELAAGGLVAFAPQHIAAPSEGDSDPSNAYGGDATHGVLGYEANAGAKMGFKFDKEHSVMVGAQWALFVPGEALAAADDEQGLGLIQKWRITADVTW